LDEQVAPDTTSISSRLFFARTCATTPCAFLVPSAALFIHRNTLLFRLNRIGEITGFYPQHLKDAINLYTALTLYKLNQFETASSNAEIEDQKEILL